MNKKGYDERKIDFCEICLDDKPYKIKEKTVTNKTRGHDITYIEKEAYCEECGNFMYVHEVNDENLETFYSKVRDIDDIINIAEIEQILDKYNIGKRPLSLLLGWGEGTITRYINGDIPTKDYSDKLKLILNDPNEMANILDINKNKITPIAYKKCKESLENILNDERALSVELEDCRKINLIAKYIVLKCEDITPLALQKLLYYAQALCKLFTGEYLFKEDCEAWVHGPVFRCVYNNYRNFGSHVIDIYEVEYIDLPISEIEEEVVNCVIKYFGCYSGKILEEMTHSELPWIISRRGLKKHEGSDRIIEKDLISSYFNDIKSKYNIVNISDIKDYSKDLFSRIIM